MDNVGAGLQPLHALGQHSVCINTRLRLAEVTHSIDCDVSVSPRWKDNPFQRWSVHSH